MLSKEKRAEIFAKYSQSKSAKDSGSPESQIALFTERINSLTEHLKTNHKDNSTRRGLLQLVGKRKSLLNYLQRKDIMRYRQIIKELGLRK